MINVKTKKKKNNGNFIKIGFFIYTVHTIVNLAINIGNLQLAT